MAVIIGRATSDQDAAVYCQELYCQQVSGHPSKPGYQQIQNNKRFLDRQACYKKLKEIFQISKGSDEVLKELQDIPL